MSLKIGADLFVMSAQTKLIETAVTVATAERLRDAQRINRVDPDAVNLPAGPSLELTGKVFQRGVRSFQDGLSALSIADDAVSELISILEQIDGLATLSSEDGLTEEQRAGLQQEVSALQSDWNRIIDTTLYNNQQLLTGVGSRLVLQGGFGSSGALTSQIGKDPLTGGFSDYAGGTTRVSTSSSGVAGNSNSYLPGISADGRYIVFYSTASNLVAGDSNLTGDLFLKDTSTGITTLVSTSSSGVQGNYASGEGLISADGRYVAFRSASTTLVAGDTNSASDVFLKDTTTGLTTRVSTDSLNQQANGSSYARAISADGRYVAFDSLASNLVIGDSNGVRDAFIKDTITGATTRVSTSSSGQEGNAYSYVRGISADGRYVVFESTATNLVTGDTNARRDVFMKDTITGVTSRLSTTSAGQQATNHSFATAISADGRYVAFESWASNLVTGDTNGARDVFIKDTESGITTRVSTTSSGGEANNLSFFGGMSADGRYVGFHSTATNLVSGDNNGQQDAFVKDTLTGTTIRVGTSSSGVEGNGLARMGAISADGRYAVFSSLANNLVSGDTNSSYDIFLRDLTKMGIQALAGMIVGNQTSAAITLNLVAKYEAEFAEHEAKLTAAQTRVGSSASILEVAAANHRAASLPIANERIASSVAQGLAQNIRLQARSAILAQANLSPSLVALLLGHD